MAEKVDAVPPRRGGGRKPKYPWDEWLDGNLRKLVHGKEFDCKAYHLAEWARDVAAKRGLKVRANVRHEEIGGVERETLYLQSHKDES